MSDIIEYKCPRCGGALEFDSDLQKMKCPYCDSVFDMEQFREMDREEKEQTEQTGKTKQAGQTGQAGKSGQTKQENAEQGWNDQELDGMKIYTCKSCGAEIIAEETLGASTCPYCGNQIVMTGNFSGDLRPDYVIPFKLKKEEALKRLKEHLKNKKLLPKVFKDEQHIDEIKGIYVPYWIFDADAEGSAQYDTTKLTGVWKKGDYRYEEYSFFDVVRRGRMEFRNIPADGSKKMPDDLMESLEPFDMNEAVEFQTAYLAGYLADRYDMSQEECAGRIRQRAEESVQMTLRNSVSGYDTVRCRSEHVEVQQKNVRYALFPVWLLNTSWRGEIYTFAMNGQTGRFIGNLPVDWTLFWLNVLPRTVLYGVIIGLLMYFFMF